MGFWTDKRVPITGRNSDGEFYRLVTAWKATKQEEEVYAKNV